MIREDIEKILELCRKDTTGPSDGTLLARIVGSSVPDKISTIPYIQKRQTRYVIKGIVPVGCDNPGPAITVFDTSVTRNADFGYYVACVLDPVGKNLHIALVQGWAQYENKYGKAVGTTEMEKATAHARELLGDEIVKFEKKDQLGENLATLSLFPAHSSICSIEYGTNALPSDTQLKNDLTKMLRTYAVLRERSGMNLGAVGLFDQEDETEESRYQMLANSREPLTPPNATKNLRRDPLERGEHKTYGRDPETAMHALKNAGHACEADNAHRSFKVKNADWMYMEAHHLIPMERQDDFRATLDVEQNIVSLCPTCHALVHNARFAEIRRIIEPLYIARRKALLEYGIDVSMETLLSYYK